MSRSSFRIYLLKFIKYITSMISIFINSRKLLCFCNDLKFSRARVITAKIQIYGYTFPMPIEKTYILLFMSFLQSHFNYT